MLGESSFHTDFIFALAFHKQKPWGYKSERDCSALWPRPHQDKGGWFKAVGTEGTCPEASPSSAAAMLEAERWKGRLCLLQDTLVLERRR